MQAVLLQKQGVFAAAFYPAVDDAGDESKWGSAVDFAGSVSMRNHASGSSFWSSFDVQTDAACALLVQNVTAADVPSATRSLSGSSPLSSASSTEVWISVSDPSQTLTAVTLQFPRLCLEGPGCGTCNTTSAATVMRVALPQQTLAGSSVSVRCNVVA